MAADLHIVADVVVTIRCLHVDVAGKAAVRFSGGRIGLDEVGHANAAPMDDLAPALDAFELRDQLVPRQLEDICHGEQ